MATIFEVWQLLRTCKIALEASVESIHKYENATPHKALGVLETLNAYEKLISNIDEILKEPITEYPIGAKKKCL